jgi:hypothetical protein
MGFARNAAISKAALSVFEVCNPCAALHKSEGPLSKFEIAPVAANGNTILIESGVDGGAVAF